MKTMYFTGLSDWIIDEDANTLELDYAKDRYLAKNCPLKVNGKTIGEVQWTIKVESWGLPFYGYFVEVWDTNYFELDESDRCMLHGAYTVEAETQSFEGEDHILVYQLEICPAQNLVDEIEHMVKMFEEGMLG